MDTAPHPPVDAAAGRPRWALRQQLLVSLTLLTVLVIGLFYGAASHRLHHVANQSAQDWATGLARLAAGELQPDLDAASIQALEAQVHKIALLNEVLQVEVRDGHGATLLWLVRQADGRLQRVGQDHGLPASLPAQDKPGNVQSWAPVGSHGHHGTVGVTVSAGTAVSRLALLRYDLVFGLTLAALTFLAATWAVVSLALRPFHKILAFARGLARHPGDQLGTVRSSRELAALAEALNHASTTLRVQWDQLRRQEDHTDAIVNAVPDAIVGFGPDGRIQVASPATASIFGRVPDALIGVEVGEVLPGLDGAMAEERTLQGLYMRSSHSHVARFDCEALRHGGTRFPVEVSLSRIESAEGVRFACVVRDLTERQMADNMLHLYGRALECIGNGVMIADLTMQQQPVFYVNPAFSTITGYGPMDLVGRSADALYGQDGEQPELTTLREAIGLGQSASVVMRSYRKDGTMFFNEQSLSPVFAADGRVTHSVAVLSDVTDRELARLAAAERSARMDTVFDLSPDGFVVFDAQGQLVFCNQAFLTMTGAGQGRDMLGTTVQTFDPWLAALCNATEPVPLPLARLWEQPALHDTADYSTVLHLQHPQPRVVSRAVRRPHQGPSETIVFLRDITHESEVDRMKSEFLTTAAHELRTPMVSVFGFTELLLHRPVPEARRRDVLETIHRQASLLITMVNELLDLARIESRQGKDLHLVDCDLGELMKRACDSMAPNAHPEQLQLRLPNHRPLRVRADSDKLTRALVNVLSNAFKYSPQGGRVVVDCESGEIDHRAAVALRVTDHGIGMSAQQCQRVFERFYRADPSGNIPGTGLGMSLVKEIIELHGGRVSLHSHPGQGTQVSLWLPLAPVAIPTPTPSPL